MGFDGNNDHTALLLCNRLVNVEEEPKDLISTGIGEYPMKDAYIVPEVPIANVSPTSEEDRKKTMREQMAMQELQKTD